MRIAGKESETVMAATIDCTVDLAADQKGVHMSRFPELFDEAIDSVVFEEALLVETSPSTSPAASSTGRKRCGPR